MTDSSRSVRVDAYLAGLPEWQRSVFSEVRQLLHQADPAIRETIKRSVQPYFVLDGNVAAFLAAKDWATVFLYDPTVGDLDGIITGGHGNATGRQISIREGEPLSKPTLVQMFRQIAAHNRAGGWRRLQTS
jgi:hypothetical protein